MLKFFKAAKALRNNIQILERSKLFIPYLNGELKRLRGHDTRSNKNKFYEILHLYMGIYAPITGQINAINSNSISILKLPMLATTDKVLTGGMPLSIQSWMNLILLVKSVTHEASGFSDGYACIEIK